MKRLKQQEIKKRIWVHILDIIDDTTIENWVDIIYGQGMPIRIEALSDYKIEKLNVMLDTIQKQIKVKVV
jgi:hypothetical protein